MDYNWQKRIRWMSVTLLVLLILVVLIQVFWGDAALSTIVAVLSMLFAAMSFFLSEKVLFSRPMPPIGPLGSASGEVEVADPTTYEMYPFTRVPSELFRGREEIEE
jgi:hypothetical protein